MVKTAKGLNRCAPKSVHVDDVRVMFCLVNFRTSESSSSMLPAAQLRLAVTPSGRPKHAKSWQRSDGSESCHWTLSSTSLSNKFMSYESLFVSQESLSDKATQNSNSYPVTDMVQICTDSSWSHAPGLWWQIAVAADWHRQSGLRNAESSWDATPGAQLQGDPAASARGTRLGGQIIFGTRWRSCRLSS